MSIRNRLLSGALGLAACGLAQAQSVEIYGTLFQFLENAKTSGATSSAPADRPSQIGAGAYTGVNDPSRNRVTAGTSNLGFRGSEDLGGGIEAIFQLESAWQVDGSPGPGFGVPATTTQAGRAGAKPDAAFNRRHGRQRELEGQGPQGGGGLA